MRGPGRMRCEMKLGRTFLLVGLFCATGCTNYYKVTDPSTGKVYYTTNLDQRGNGAATLTDARTGETVNIQNSEISKINEKQFEAGKYTPAPAAK
jgi:hypothetical protein